MCHPSLVSSGLKVKPLVLVLAPLTPLENWVSETDKWLDDLDSRFPIYNMRRSKEFFNQKKDVDKWKKHGGMLLMDYPMFTSICKKEKCMIDLLQPDVLVLDEAHTALKNQKTQLFQNLNSLKTKRRVLLSGTPLSNNLNELYNMMEFATPGLMQKVFGTKSEGAFKENYR